MCIWGLLQCHTENQCPTYGHWRNCQLCPVRYAHSFHDSTPISTQLYSCFLYSLFIQMVQKQSGMWPPHMRTGIHILNARTCNIMLHNMCWLYNHLRWLFCILYSIPETVTGFSEMSVPTYQTTEYLALDTIAQIFTTVYTSTRYFIFMNTHYRQLISN